ncbi:16S rRNA processing protein RimM [Propionibacterium sp. oral taxon 192 str. F0372]|uniref:ribosome maturation factor RimM n=1 Tax=Propionibacterium sp. oral taxon 192 TaxID=671222 RepID=UPI000353446C|nr:ribosome maturation factor RimM [Propionibacterium sp. oral taxon 192]EPH00245.1 16S rRNA processing protein RimM [Propionibacterium sp. oral taxon 192 str. F0372]
MSIVRHGLATDPSTERPTIEVGRSVFVTPGGMMSSTVEVLVAVVGRAHGVRGDVTLTIRTDEPERRFVPGQQVRTSTGRVLEIAAARNVSGRWQVHFVSVDDRTEAQTLTGVELFANVPADESPEGDEEYYDRQLIGLRVLRADGSLGGVVSEVIHGAAQDLLVVDVEGTPRLVPFVSALVPVINLTGGWLQLADVGGLLEEMTQ